MSWEPYHQDERDDAAGCLMVALSLLIVAFLVPLLAAILRPVIAP